MCIICVDIEMTRESDVIWLSMNEGIIRDAFITRNRYISKMSNAKKLNKTVNLSMYNWHCGFINSEKKIIFIRK